MDEYSVLLGLLHMHTIVFSYVMSRFVFLLGFPENMQFSDFRHRFEVLVPPENRPDAAKLDEKQVGRDSFYLIESKTIILPSLIEYYIFRPSNLKLSTTNLVIDRKFSIRSPG